MSNFKAKVLDRAIKQINKHTDITVTYEQHKTGRTITAMSFTFKAKKAAKQTSTDDGFINMTDKQISTFSAKLARLTALSNDAPQGKSFDYYASIIAVDLKDADRQKKYIKHLAKLGFEIAKSKVK